MSFTAINSASIEVGDALKKELFDLIKNNFDDIETRVNAFESASSKIDIFKFLLLNGSSFPTATGLSYYRAETAFTITKSAIQVFETTGLTGYIEIDIKKSITDMNSTSFTSIFTTKPKITLPGSDYAESTNQVLNGSMINIVAGNYLRLDITITPTSGPLPKMLITSYGE